MTSLVKKLRTYSGEAIEQLDCVCQMMGEQALAALLNDPRYRDERRLARSEWTVFSQAGEDGMLREVFRRITTTSRTFVEFGAADGSQNNTKFLLRTGWRGLWIEADPGRVAAITTRHRQSIERGDLVVMNRCVTPDNITALLVEAQIPADLDLLSIDIDGADYHVWEALTGFSPRVVMIEYNSIYPPDVAHVPPYHSASQWDRSRDFGASLKALQQLGDRLGYKLVGCNLAGVNAVFVREDLVADAFCAPFTAENHYEPPRYYLTLRRFGHRPSSF